MTPFIVVIAWCGAFDTGTRCGAMVPPYIFKDQAECLQAQDVAKIIVTDAIAENGGVPFFLRGSCLNIGAEA